MISFWEQQSFTTYDYIVVGGGIVGLSTAAELLEQDRTRRVLVLERGLFPSGASTKNAGFACFGSLTELLIDMEKLGADGCLALVNERWSGLRKLRERLGDKEMDFQQWGGYELIREQEMPALARMKEVNDLLWPLFRAEVFEEQPDTLKKFGFGGPVNTLVYNPFEGQIDTGKTLKRLIAYCRMLGADVLTGAKVDHVEERDNEVQVRVETPQGQVEFRAQGVAICTNAFTKTFFPDMDIQPGRGLVVVTRPIAELPFKGTFHYDEGYFYFRNFGNRVIFGGGRNLDPENETTTEFGINPLIEGTLHAHLSEILLPGHTWEIEHTWSGIMAFGPVKEPIVRQISPRIVAGVRLGGMGVAIGSRVAERLGGWLAHIQ
jgi:gamma-glutamylputrescine oxidase